MHIPMGLEQQLDEPFADHQMLSNVATSKMDIAETIFDPAMTTVIAHVRRHFTMPAGDSFLHTRHRHVTSQADNHNCNLDSA